MPRHSSRCSASLDIRDSQKVLLPGPPTPGVPNFSRILSVRAQGSNLSVKKRKKPEQSTMRNPSKVQGVKRWDAKTHKTANWDGLRRDEELWQQDGDCLVHLYGQGKSKRGASLRTSYAQIEQVAGESFLSTYLASDSNSCTESLDGTTTSTSSTQAEHELYIAAPEDAVREDAYRWHVTTRNFFAYIEDKPLVGSSLGKTLIDLLERIQLFCPDKANNNNNQYFLAYAQRQGYTKFVNRPDYALAFLNFSERFKLKDLWIDAFAHCVGMNEQLDLSPEFDEVSKVTKALITRSYLEMDLHLGRVSKALKTFLEDELAPTHLGLPTPARNHLDRFRSFMHSYYVNKFGYWPPETGAIMDKGLLRSIHQEFQLLYDYLVDRDSSPSQSPSKLLTGGICVMQNVDAFNARHNYEPLPHPSPLLPDYYSLEYRTASQKGLKSLRLASKPSKAEQSGTARAALSAATNKLASSSPLVRNYVYFEGELTFRPEEKLSVGDARKVRWIAIYSILQMLTNAIRAPKEVVDSEAVPYHLCLLTTGMPPWNEDVNSVATPQTSTPRPVKMERENSDKTVFTIHPDCEDNDYFSHKTMPKRCDSHSSLRPQPLRINTTSGMNRTSSIRSLHKSLTSNFSFPSRRNSVKSPLVSTEISGASNTADSSVNKRFSGYSFAISEEENLDYLNPHQPEASSFENHYRLPEARTPTLDVFMLDSCASPELPSTPLSTASSSMSPTSVSSRMWDNSPNSVSSDDLDWYERHSSAGVYGMDHDSVYSDQVRKSSKSSSVSSGSNTPIVDLSTLTASFAAAATAKMLYTHAGLTSQHENQQQAAQMPAWWSTSNDKRQSGQISVPEEVPEEDVMAGRKCSGEFTVDRGLESTVDIFDAMRLLN
ncbi:hypothetical protein D6D00_01386 [Aureobasidium pullulans]|nr:hypothetical protein D6D00_01386 [Aureobasidium pullulans]